MTRRDPLYALATLLAVLAGLFIGGAFACFFIGIWHQVPSPLPATGAQADPRWINTGWLSALAAFVTGAAAVCSAMALHDKKAGRSWG